MSRLVAKLWAFFYRDFLNEVSYRTSFLLQLGGSFFFVTTWFFVSRFVARAFEPPGDLPGVSYFAFVLVGFAFYQYLQATLTSFSAKIRREQLTGTLEAMLVTPTPASLVILGSTAWDFLMTTFRVAAILVMGSLRIGIDRGLHRAVGEDPLGDFETVAARHDGNGFFVGEFEYQVAMVSLHQKNVANPLGGDECHARATAL